MVETDVWELLVGVGIGYGNGKPAVDGKAGMRGEHGKIAHFVAKIIGEHINLGLAGDGELKGRKLLSIIFYRENTYLVHTFFYGSVVLVVGNVVDVENGHNVVKNADFWFVWWRYRRFVD